jgi:hypothetical protein
LKPKVDAAAGMLVDLPSAANPAYRAHSEKMLNIFPEEMARDHRRRARWGKRPFPSSAKSVGAIYGKRTRSKPSHNPPVSFCPMLPK